jgi:4-hydroxybenzoate polyprenyltransferase/phosphoserine phosphatase
MEVAGTSRRNLADPISRPLVAVTEPAIPLCIDLDGTLIRSDLLVESGLSALAGNPWLVLALPGWLLAGKANLKQALALRSTMDMDGVPLRPEVLALVDAARSEGREVVLVTASDRRLAEAMARRLGIDTVLASDGTSNLAGDRKAQALVELYGVRGFDYVGDGRVDLPVWRAARRAIVVGSARLAAAAALGGEVHTHIHAPRPRLSDWVRAIRLHQWLKNLLVFVPLFSAHRAADPLSAALAVGAFFAFGLCASGVYVLNDLLDLDADRRHPRKRMRPFADGAIPLLHGAIAAPLLMALGLAFAWALAPPFALLLLGYTLVTLAYSLRLKRVPVLDVMLLASLYTLRIIGGALAIGAMLSFWLLAFSMFVFLSLAMLKRYIELGALLRDGGAVARGYSVDDLPLIQSLGAASGYLAVLVLALYINSPESLALYQRPQVLWLLCPLLLYWISRAWMVAHRGAMDDDPVVFAATDRVSQMVAVAGGAIALAAT